MLVKELSVIMMMTICIMKIMTIITMIMTEETEEDAEEAEEMIMTMKISRTWLSLVK